MSELRNRIEGRIRSFVADVEALLRDEAIALVTGALRATGAASGARAPGRRPGRPARTARPAAAAPRRTNGVPGRRAPAQMQKDMDALVAYVRAHPGAKMEEIAKATRSTSHRLNRPMHKLVKTGALKRKGQKRATRYWVGGR